MDAFPFGSLRIGRILRPGDGKCQQGSVYALLCLVSISSQIATRI